MSKGIFAPAVAAEFLNHSNEELGHADLLATRIVQLGGAPDFAPAGLAERSHAEYVQGASLQDMIHENLVAERIAVNSYRDLITYLGTDDPTTSEMLKTILAVEEKHANELADLLQYFPRIK
jgi:bacterioferritin